MVCVLILFSLFAYFFAQREQQAKEQSFQTATDSFEHEFSQQIASFQGIADNIVYYQGISPFELKGHYTMAQQVIRTLHSSMMSNPILSSLSVYFFQDSYAYSHQHSLKISELEKIWGLDLSASGPLAKSLEKKGGQPLYLPFQRCDKLAGEQLVILYPFWYNYEIKGLILMSVPSAEMELLLGNQDGSSTRTFLFWDGKLICPENLPEDPAFSELPDLVPSISGTGFHWENSRIRLRAGEVAPGLVYLRTEGKRNSFSGLLSNPAAYVLLGLLTAAAIIFVTLTVTRRSYRPVREFGESLEGNQAPDGKLEEFQAFFTKYSTLEEKNRQLEDAVRKKFAAEQDYILRCILDGTADQYDDFAGRALDLGIDLSMAYYMLILHRGTDSEFPSTIRPLQEYTHCEIYRIRTRNGTVYLIGMDRRPPEQLLDLLAKSGNLAIGRITEELRELHQDYMELQMVGRETSTFRIPDGNSAAAEQYSREIRRITDSLEAKDRVGLKEGVQACLSLITSGTLPLETQKYICFHILYSFQNYAELHLSGAQEFFPDRALEQPGCRETVLLLETESSRMQELLASQQEQESKPLLSIERILSYIQEHYTEPDFSLQKTAAAFDVSQSYLSTFFRDNYKMKMLDYCTLLRMEKAKELLQNTDLTLEKISEQIGYFNTSSFIRRFKQLYGLTPGEFKKQLSAST